MISEKDIPSLSERVKIIKSLGSLAILQIHHGGTLCVKQYKFNPLVPSEEITNKELKDKGILNDNNRIKELNDNEIKDLIDKYNYAAELSLKAGFDGVEIHVANNYIIQQFYSPSTNRRKDD